MKAKFKVGDLVIRVKTSIDAPPVGSVGTVEKINEKGRPEVKFLFFSNTQKPERGSLWWCLPDYIKKLGEHEEKD